MGDILEDILAHKRVEVEREKAETPPSQFYPLVEKLMEEEGRTCECASDGSGMHQPKRRSMHDSLAASPTGIIAEFKRKSPSKGWIKEEGRADVIPAAYAQAGAAALSILTDAKYFGGSLDFVRTARPMVDIPILRKEFVVDEYQLYQARQVGADAVLLIAAALSVADCVQLVKKAHELQLEVLLEIHSEMELDYVTVEPDMLGVNNRNLGTFHTDVENSFRISSLLPHDMLRVSESGISNPDTVKSLREAGFRGFLMGEAFMRCADPGDALRAFINALEQ